MGILNSHFIIVQRRDDQKRWLGAPALNDGDDEDDSIAAESGGGTYRSPPCACGPLSPVRASIFNHHHLHLHKENARLIIFAVLCM